MSRRRNGTRSRNRSEINEAERNYGIGRRNPTTLPDYRANSESWRDNQYKSRNWRQARAWAASVAAVGAKYI